MEINMQDILELDTETLVELRDKLSAEVDNRKFHDELKKCYHEHLDNLPLTFKNVWDAAHHRKSQEDKSCEIALVDLIDTAILDNHIEIDPSHIFPCPACGHLDTLSIKYGYIQCDMCGYAYHPKYPYEYKKDLWDEFYASLVEEGMLDPKISLMPSKFLRFMRSRHRIL